MEHTDELFLQGCRISLASVSRKGYPSVNAGIILPPSIGR